MRATGKSVASARRLRRQLSLPEMLLWRLLKDPEAAADQIYRLCEAAAGPSTTQPGG